ncbi:MAG: TldD/PmbA family protein, partial [Blastocatellia bacterium]
MITRELLSDIVNQAIRRGATDAEAVGLETTEFHVEVRLGEVEKLQEAASRGVGLRVLYQGRQASSSTSDVSPQAIDELISSAVEMAKLTSVDEAATLPAREELATASDDLGLYDTAIAELPTERKIEIARSAEEAARGADSRITNSEGAACSTAAGKTILVTSAGFAGEYQGTTCSLMVAPIAKEGDQMQVAVWGDRQRSLASLDSPEELGQEAARRALRKLNARKVTTQEAPIVFESGATEELLSDFFGAVEGYSIFRRASFLVGHLGEQIAAPELTVIDDGQMRGAVGSRPFDGEGLATRRTVVLENGVLKNYLLNTYTARKLGMRSTANAARGLTGAPIVGFSNFFIAPGVYSP